jgi:branched-chain amino acid transport system substrate-binding protein
MPAPARLGLQMRAAGIPALLQGPASLVRDRRVIADLGASAEGSMAFEEGAPIEDLPGGSEFESAYRAAGFAEPCESFGPFAHAATTLIMDAIDRCGPDRAKVTAALGRTADHPSLIGPITFNPKGQNVAVPITPYVAEDGVWTPWRRSIYAHGRRRLPCPPRATAPRS